MKLRIKDEKRGKEESGNENSGKGLGREDDEVREMRGKEQTDR